MRKYSLTAIARHRLEHARSASSGRSAETVYGGHEHLLRQTVIALAPGRQLAELRVHGEATLYIVLGRIRLTSENAQWEAIPGDLLALTPSQHHRLEALPESVVLLTVAKPR
jgi:quercetin dioxygenase-like cupin family protein